MKPASRPSAKPRKTGASSKAAPRLSPAELAWALPLLAGSAILPWYPWDLILLLGSLGIFLLQRIRAGDPKPEAVPELRFVAPRPVFVASMAGLAAAVVCGCWLFRFFTKSVVLLNDAWHPVWAVAAVAFVCLAAAALALPARPKPPKRTASAPTGDPTWRTLLFWGGCLQTALGMLQSPALSAVGFCVALACAPPPPPAGTSKPKPRFWAALGLVAGSGLFFHIWQLRDIPQGINHEETITLQTAWAVLDNQGQYFALNWATFSGVTLFQHLVGWFYRLFPRNDIAPLRAISGLGWAVLALYTGLLAAELFSMEAALGAAAYACLSFACIHYGRFGFYYIWTPAVAAAALAHAVWALKSRFSALHFSLCGAWCALAVYGWISGFVIPVLPLLYLLAVLGFDRRKWRPFVPGLICAGAAFLSLASAGLAAYLYFPGGLKGLFPGNSGLLGGHDTLSSNLLLQWNSLFSTGTTSAMHYLPGLPLVAFPIAPFCAAGLATLLRRPFSRRSLPLLAACGLGVLPAWISDPMGMNFGRLILLLFPLGILFGLGWSSCLQALKRLPEGLGGAWPFLGLALLALALGREPWLYFHDYKMNKAAIKANFGSFTVMAREFLRGRTPQEALYYTENYDEASSLVFLLPENTNHMPWRDAPDVLRLFSTVPTGRYLASTLRVDWLPWLREQEPGLDSKEIESPWGMDYTSNRLGLKSVGTGNVLALSLRWKAFSPKAGLKKTAPGRWEGILWPPRADDYVLSVDTGTLLLAGKYTVSAGRPKSFHLQAVPYRVLVTHAQYDPGAEASIQRVFSEEWSQPFLHGLDLHGLRKTLRALNAKPGDPAMISLIPVVSERFDIWSYEPFESLVGLPMQGDWEGRLRVPKSGSYTFTVPNTFDQKLELTLDGKTYFSTLDGETVGQKEAVLSADRSVELRIRAENIPPAGALRFLVEGPTGPTQAVPADWMSPAPLPDPLPSNPKDGGQHAEP